MTRLFALVGAGLLAACATAPPELAVTEFDANKVCDEGLDYAGAMSLDHEKPKKRDYQIRNTVDADTACIETESGPRNYVLFAMPSRDGATITAGSVLEPLRILVPAIETLDADGNVVRSFQGDDFKTRGVGFGVAEAMTVVLRPREEEAYILFTTDAGRVGENRRSIDTFAGTNTIYYGYGAASYNVGSETLRDRTYSYEGDVFVRVQLPKDEKK